MTTDHVTNHAYEGDGGPCRAEAYGRTCGAPRTAHELEEESSARAPLSPDYEHPECGFHWHGRDGMDIPMRDGQPVCPRCELRSVEKRLRRSERLRAEVGEESRRRGRNVLDQSEKIRALEREIDGVRLQLGAEILRADQAEKARAEVLRVVSDWCVEANDCGGVDATDLAFRLEQAGHQLPDEETTAPAEEAAS